MAKNINIAGKLHAVTSDHIVVSTDEVFDDNKGKKQNQLNTEMQSSISAEIERAAGVEAGLSDRLEAIEELAEISIEGGTLELATSSSDITSGSGKVPTANAVNEVLQGIGYFECSTDANIAAKTIAATGYSLRVGGNIRIKMTNANTADAVTLNINNTGAKALFYNGVQASSTNSWKAGEVLEVYYDGTQFQCQMAIGEENNETLYFETKDNYIATFTLGGYIDKDNNVVTASGFMYCKNLDVSQYDAITIASDNAVNAVNLLMDENYNVLRKWHSSASTNDNINLKNDYPTAKYLSVTNQVSRLIFPYVDGIHILGTPIKEELEGVKEKATNAESWSFGKSLLFDIPITKEKGIINILGEKVEGDFDVCENIDIEDYSYIVIIGNTIGTLYNCLKDKDGKLLSVKQNSATSFQTTFDIEHDYPTAKYLSASSAGNPTLAVCGIKKTMPVSDILYNIDEDYFLVRQKISIIPTDGFYKDKRKFAYSTTSTGYKSNVICVKEGLTFKVTSNGSANTLNYIMYNSNLEMVNIVYGNIYVAETITIPSGVSYIEFFSYQTSLLVSCEQFEDGSSEQYGGNILNGKSYVALGDSFTGAIGSETIEEGKYAGQSKVYPYIIANRNNMGCLNQGASGTTLNGYIARGRYNDIPLNIDYVTIWYGINDNAHGIEIGTVDDEVETISAEGDTTTCGGFNWIFKWLLTNRPYSHIGVIVTDFTSAERREAIIACCEKWGIAYLDLYNPTVPMIRTRGTTRYAHDTNIAPLGYVEVCSEAKHLRTLAFSLDGVSDAHPNNACHEWQSNLIENFMRGL